MGRIIRYQYGANNPACNIDINGDSIIVYTETNAYGHSWLSIGEGKDKVVYSYGRYNGTYKGQQGIGSSNGVANGDGVLLRLTGKEAMDYQTEKNSLGADAFAITDIADEDARNMLDEIFSSSPNLPNNPKGQYFQSPNARIIGNYKLLDNNCTTFVSDVLNNLQSNALNTINMQINILGNKLSFNVKQRFVLPARLQWHLNMMSNDKNGVVRKIN